MADKEAIVALSSQIWDGHDYLHHKFDAWVADKQGRFNVVYDQETLIGCNKLTAHSPTEWWLEGIRVSPQYRGRGIARQLHQYALAVADQIGHGHLRLSTADSNQAIQKLCLDTGFTLVSHHLIARLPARPTTNPSPFQPVTTADFSLFQKKLHQHSLFKSCHGLSNEGWSWYETLPRLPQWLAEGRLFWWTPVSAAPHTPPALIIAQKRSETVCYLNFIAPPTPAALPALWQDLPQLATRFGCTHLDAKPVAVEAWQQAIQQAAGELRDFGSLVYERPLPLIH